MSLLTVNGDVLIPHKPDWRQRVGWTRDWQTAIRSSVTGSEERVSLRPRGRRGIRYRFIAFDDAEHGEFLARARKVLLDGRAAVPFFGRSVGVTAPIGVGATSITLDAEPSFEWAVGDSLWIADPRSPQWALWEVVVIAGIAGTTLTLAAGVTGAYLANARVWAILNGKASIGDGELLDDWRGGWTIEVNETVIREAPTH